MKNTQIEEGFGPVGTNNGPPTAEPGAVYMLTEDDRRLARRGAQSMKECADEGDSLTPDAFRYYSALLTRVANAAAPAAPTVDWNEVYSGKRNITAAPTGEVVDGDVVTGVVFGRITATDSPASGGVYVAIQKCVAELPAGEYLVVRRTGWHVSASPTFCPACGEPGNPDCHICATPSPTLALGEVLTDAQCMAIYAALDNWASDVDSNDFGLPWVAGGGSQAGCEVIRRAAAAALQVQS